MRSCIRITVGVVLLLLVSRYDVYAMQDCGFARGDTLLTGEGIIEEYHLVNPELVATNPRFTSNFFIYTSWDYTNPQGGRWGIADLSLFAHYIVDEVPEIGIETDLAQVILDYFAVDADPGPNIAIQNTEVEGGVTHYFTIFLDDVEGYANADANDVKLHISNASGQYGSNPWFTPAELALDGFAHEWQHTCHEYYSRGPAGGGVSARTFGGDNVDFNEMCSKMSERLFGVGLEVSLHETLYTLPTITHPGSYSQSCECQDPPGSEAEEACLGDNAHYVQYGLFGNYINSKFTLTNPDPPYEEQDLFTRWLDLTDLAALPDTVYLHDFDGLSQLVGDQAFGNYFTQSALFGSGDEGRWRELMHRFYLAEFVNFEINQPDELLTLYQWLPPLPGGLNSPQYLYGLFDNRNDDWYRKIHVYPPYLNIGNETTRLAGLVECADLWEEMYPGVCDEPSWPPAAQWGFTRKQLEATSYSANYFVLNATAGNSGRLRVRFGIEPSFDCIIGDETQGGHDYSWVSEENTANLDGQGLYYVLVGYKNILGTPNPVNNRLSEFNNEADIDIIAEGYLEHLNVGSGGELTTNSFGLGETYEACMFMLSAADHAVPGDGVGPSGEIIPYWLEVDVIPDGITFTSGSITGTVEWGPNQVYWINEDIVVAEDASLTILPGTKVWLTGAGDEVSVSGSLSIQGSELTSVEMAATTAFGGSGSLQAITVENGGTCSIDHASLTTLGQIVLADNIAGFSLSNSDVTFSDTDVLAGIQSNPIQTQTSSINGCTIRNAVVLKLANAVVSDCDIHQRLSGLGEHPLILVDRGVTSISATNLSFLKLGIDTQPQSSKSGNTVYLETTQGNYLYGIGQQNVTGVSIQLGCSASIQSTFIKNGFTTGIEINSGGALTLRESEIHASDVCVLAAKGSSVDLGLMLPDENCTPGEPGCDPGRNEIRSPNQDCVAICVDPDPLTCQGTETQPNLSATRVFNRTSSPIWAHGNCWGPCNCPGEYFVGSPVYFDVWDPAPDWACDLCPCLSILCPTGGFSFIAGDGADGSESSDYMIDANPIFFERCVVSRAGNDWVHSLREVAVYDVLGRRVRSLGIENGGGRPSIVWEGRGDSGRRAAAGVYFIRISEASRQVTFKVIKLR
jgi:hypothetical protein